MVHKEKIKGTSHIHGIIYATLASLLFFGVFISMKNQVPVPASDKKIEDVSPLVESTKMYNTDAFNGVSVSAQSYIVYDPVSGLILSEKNSLKSYPLASVTKVMTALVADKTISKDKSINIVSSDLAPEGSSGLRVGDTWERDKLIQYMLSVSSNDGARALARVGGGTLTSSTTTKTAVDNFVLEMNNFAKQNNMPSLVFNNESGLDISSGKAGAEGNAQDVALMFWYAYKNPGELFETTTQSITTLSSAEGSNVAKNTNLRASNIPGLALSKTGYTDLASGNLGVVIETSIGRPVVIVVLHSTKEGRFTDVETLRKATLESMR